MPVIEIKSLADFEKLFSSRPTHRYVFVDFYASWCGPCMRIAPVVEKLSNEFPDMIFVKIDVDRVPELARGYAITSMPTFKIFDLSTRQVVGETLGADPSAIRRLIETKEFA